METLTCRKALDLLSETVNEKGRDYAYPEDQECVYFTETTETHASGPSCILGHIFARLGAQPEQFSDINTKSILDIADELSFMPNADQPERQVLVKFLGAIQADNDDRMPWGYILDEAQSHLEFLKNTARWTGWTPE